ncbi:beta-hexosaminidase [Lachnospiraceae bacterium]|jgi:beta-N-acetylhexosaminidase|nr:glycoside hydrolase family 3 N-terminal domain-containing protein [uncultured Schaedlerella sp.]MCI9155240.1 beta-hexosaminidase [Ruminococcus sp.]NBI60417.1 beta-hexosaminidase [Lachnospiraceae bacterium]
MVDMKAKPFYLTDEDCKWVEDTIAGMTLDEKIGQLFFNMGSSREEEYLKMTVRDYHIGGIRYNPATADEVYEQNRILQESSKIPLIIACNTESGGDGACVDGTPIGGQTKIGATRNADYAYQMGYMANKEAAAIGCNLSFAPVSDIMYNWENPVIGLRTYGNEPKKVAEMTKAYMDGAHANPGFCCAAKHFPGDGLDFRDQHVANSVNSMSCEEWDKTYGRVYQNLIENGLDAIMAGHIMQPAYARYFNPELTDDEMMPATLSPELIKGLLRGKLGFNGLVLTDASHMVGLTCRMKRGDMLPAAIAAGVDMFLFFNEMEEDFASMKQGYLDGRITKERLDEALHRILALKAHMGLHKKDKTKLIPPREQVHKIIGCDEHVAMQKEIADQAITLVKYKDKDVLPVTSDRYKRIMIVYVKGLSAPGLAAITGVKKSTPAEELRDRLIAKGFDAFIYESPIDQMIKKIEAGEKPDVNLYFAGKTPIKEFRENQDLIITLVDIAGGFQPVARPAFGMTKGGGEIPWYVFELPVIVVGTQYPYVLADIPQARTYINTYDSKPVTLDALVEKLMTGEEAFKGKDPIGAFCGIFDTHI